MAKVKADLHNHLRTSSILRNEDFNQAIDLASKRLGSSGIFAMVNFYDKRYENFISLKGYNRDSLGENANGIYIPDKDVAVVKGQEIPTKQGHLLVLGLGYEVHLKGDRPLEDTIKEARDNNGIIIADHPFFREGVGNYLDNHQDLIRHFDALEIHNGKAALSLFGLLPKRANEKAKEFYERAVLDNRHLGALSSSDGHSMYELGSSWTEIDSPDLANKANFVSSLRESISQTSLSTERQNLDSRIGALDHIADLLYITKIAPKIGLAVRFETERPENN